jgi:uncharacterized protein
MVIPSALLCNIDPSLANAPYVCCWREGDKEVDFVLRKGKNVVALEVKSGRRRDNTKGVGSFSMRHKPLRTLLIGEEGILVEDFLESDPCEWLR